MNTQNESVCTPIRNAACMMFDAGFSVEEVKSWLATVSQPVAGYVRLTDIPNTGSIK